MVGPHQLWSVIVGALIVVVAFLLRVVIHAGRTPSGVDTWYLLAYADAIRKRPRLEVRLPQYLLQDERQSYAPLFPTFLALIPGPWLRRWFWVVSPAIDCAHLTLLYWLAYKITGSITAAAVSAGIYAFTPQLISETRSLNGRAFGALLHTAAMVLLLRYVISGEPWPWLPLAVLAGAGVFLASATASLGYGVVSFALSLVFAEPRCLLVSLGALAAAVILSAGHFLRVVWNYVEAARYWRRNLSLMGAHPIHDSPIYGQRGRGRGVAPSKSEFLGANPPQRLLRLVGENPFLLALPLAPYTSAPWGPWLYWWAMSLAILAVAATLLPQLRLFGPGRSYMKVAVFPTAYTLAVGVGSASGLATPVGLAVVASLALSLAAILFFYRYMARRVTEHTATAPPGLAHAVRYLAGLPGDGVLCLPYMYADYTCYHSGKRTLWGGHCGDLSRFEYLSPVIIRPLPELLREYGVHYVLLDKLYTTPEEIGLDHALEPLSSWDSFVLYRIEFARLPLPTLWRADISGEPAPGG